MPRNAMTGPSVYCRMPALLLMLALAAGATGGAALYAQTTGTTTSATNTSLTAAATAAGATTTAGATSRGGALLSALASADARFKARFYASPLGKLLMNMRKPLSALTGGLVQGDSPHAGKYAGAGGSPAMGVAAKIKADAKQAAERREAVRFLGTVDCHYYPEAEQAIISALRCDRSECVRMEAALALGRGCCCTKKTMEALKIAVSGSNRDGNPGETSLRVRMTALEALQNCLANCNPIESTSPPPAVRPEYPGAPLAPEQELPISAGDVSQEVPANFRYYAGLDATPMTRVLSEAKQIASRASLAPQPQLGGYGTGRRNLVSLWERAASPESVASPMGSFQPTPAPPEMRVANESASRVDASSVNAFGANSKAVDVRSFGVDPYAVAPHVAPPTREAPFDPASVPFPSSSYPPPTSLRRTPPVEQASGSGGE